MAQDSERLFPTVSRERIAYCDDVEVIDRLMVRIADDGTLLIKGHRKDIDALIAQLTVQGVVVQVRYNSFCG